jgi:hypothetical protein
METAGHKRTWLYEAQGFSHGGMHNPGIDLLTKEVDSVFKKIEKKGKG